jgi:ferritin-like metal-binding protein YciE
MSMASAQWLDDDLRKQLEHKQEELRGQLQDIERVLNGGSGEKRAATAEHRIVRAGRKPLSAEARAKIGRRMKALWRERKKKLGTP